MKRYPVYETEDKLPGTKEIPAHWGVVRNSFIFKEISETGYGHLELLSILSDRGIVKQSETGRKERAPEDRSSYKRILKGDIGYNLMNAFSGSIGVSNYEGIISPAYAVCRPKVEIDGNYFHYLFRTDLYLTEFDRYAYGIMYERNRLYFEDFKRIYVPFPPLEEQKQIARFLDLKLEQIDHFISNKQRLIELLKEQKTAIVNHVVTKGLNPHAPMKASGIEWLGEIPAHWEVKSFRRVTTRIEVGIAEAATHAYTDKGIPIIRSTNVKTNFIELDNILHIQKWFADKNRSKYIYMGDILTVRTGANAGMTSVVPKELNHSQCFTLLISTPSPQHLPQFYSFYINSPMGQEFFSIEGWGAAQVNLSVPILQNLPVVEPPYEEQQAIVSFIEKESEKIDQAIAKVEKEIELIQEYRTTLISDAVTGKIDVREPSAVEPTLTAAGI